MGIKNKYKMKVENIYTAADALQRLGNIDNNIRYTKEAERFDVKKEDIFFN